MSLKHCACSLGCVGGLNIAPVITSIYQAPFLVSPCFLLDICFMQLQSDTAKPIASWHHKGPSSYCGMRPWVRCLEYISAHPLSQRRVGKVVSTPSVRNQFQALIRDVKDA